MTQQLESKTSVKGVEVDGDVSGEIEKVIEERSSEMETLLKSDFRRVF